MKHLVISALVLAAVATPAIAKGGISAIEDAGIYSCEEPGSTAIAKKWLPYVEKCRGKTSCTIKPTDVVSAQDLARAKCTGFFINYWCGTKQHNLEAKTYTDKLVAKCK